MNINKLKPTYNTQSRVKFGKTQFHYTKEKLNERAPRHDGYNIRNPLIVIIIVDRFELEPVHESHSRPGHLADIGHFIFLAQHELQHNQGHEEPELRVLVPVHHQQFEREQFADIAGQLPQTFRENVVVHLEVCRVVYDDFRRAASEEKVRQVQDWRSSFCQLPVD